MAPKNRRKHPQLLPLIGAVLGGRITACARAYQVSDSMSRREIIVLSLVSICVGSFVTFFILLLKSIIFPIRMVSIRHAMISIVEYDGTL